MSSKQADGIAFEQYIRSLFEQCHCRVFDTPVSHDYGADLIVHYKNHVIAVQCKFYQHPVGLSAVQEVLGSQKMYSATDLMVVTNNYFTQQAIDLAVPYNVILVDGSMLPSFTSDSYGNIALFDRFLFPIQTAPSQVEELNLNDLVIRYGLSKAQITRYILSAGLPFFKVGREYRVLLSDLEKWEIRTKLIHFGRDEFLYLPAWIEYVSFLKNEIKNAKKANNKTRLKILRKKLRKAKISKKNIILRTCLMLIFIPVVFLFFFYFQEYLFFF